MTTTSQDQKPEGQSGTSPAEKPEGKQKSEGVPVGEHVEQRQELRQAREEADRLRTELETLRKSQAKGPEKAETDMAAQVQAIVDRQRQQDLMSELALADQKQGKAVFDLMRENANLTSAEALMIAKARNADLFDPTKHAGGFDPAVHGSRNPRAGDAPPIQRPNEREERLSAIQKLMTTNKQAATDVAANYLGHLAAQVAGREHHLIDLPRN